MRLALAVINPTVGDVAGNVALMRGAWVRAAEAGADVVVFPELAVTGYPPKDLLLRRDFVEAAMAAARGLGEGPPTGTAETAAIIGVPMWVGAEGGAGKNARGGVTNSLVVYRGGRLLARYDKRLLPTYDVFDEDRYFVAGERAVVVELPVKARGVGRGVSGSAARGGAGAGEDGGQSVRVGLSICEDLWRGQDVGFAERYLRSPDPVAELLSPPDGSAGAEVIVNPSASPFVLGKPGRHRALLTEHARRGGVVVAAVNQVGGNDELIFDGHAAVIGPDGGVLAASSGFTDEVVVVDVAIGGHAEGTSDEQRATRGEGRGVRAGGRGADLLSRGDDELLFRALVMGIADYCRKTGFKTAVLGLSGGIDSAVTAVLAAAALGPANVLGLAMPSRYSSEHSRTDAAELARRLGMGLRELSIEPGFEAMLGTLGPMFEGRAADVTEENLQSRLRGTLLMAASNKLGSILLTTGNKSELAVGYCTLYGDMNGGLAVLADTTKQWVYRLARHMNARWGELGIDGLKGPPIPESSISKAPSAELRPNQTDQDSLPPYEVLDAIIEGYVERRESPREIVTRTGADAATVARVVRMIDLAEYKRKQAPVGLKVTGVAFGSGRRMPIAQRYRPGE